MLPLLASVAATSILIVQQSFLNSAASVPLGAERVVMLSVTLSASCAADVPVASFTLLHAGLGHASDIARVYALEAGQRISRSAMPDAHDGHVTIRLTSFIVPSCSKRTLLIAADMRDDVTVGGEHRFSIKQWKDVSVGSDATVQVLLPSAPVTVIRTVGPVQGSLSAVFLTDLLPVTYGVNRSVARFRLTADGPNDQRVSAITLVNGGKARDSDLQNLFLSFNDGRSLTGILPSMDHDRVRFVFDPPLTIGRGHQRIFSLHADVRAGRRQTIAFSVQEPSDIEAEISKGRTPFAP